MSESRTYRGLSAQERVAERRGRVLAAAFDRFGTQGYPATTIDLLCADAKISTRAFYQCFDGREAVLSAVYSDIVDEAMAIVRSALDQAGDAPRDLVRAGLCAYIRYMISDERRARIAHVEVRRAGDPLVPQRLRTVNEFAALMAGLMRDHTVLEEIDHHNLAIGLIGAVQELITTGVQGDPRPTEDDLLRTAQYIFLSALPN
ncbi:TetR/AcrR family transcriptional regulator [Actinomadura alba]|uniref:TetR/AcrR family transcriptional regulator n=1 Tax=Actinomadura alba TaxID=406431 RepID=A0ABR7LM19_9ACTN|nr:TetR/AcrR family transcriptional regulator [Actinomadura alba]MBC6465902.1 TetR/AcrR family transcriptional regulator [Actinomadura alba]